MKRLTLRHNSAQFIIDITFGIALLVPLVYGVITGAQYTAILVTIGVGVGYSLHMIQKVLLYEELLSEEVKDHIETEVEKTVPKQTQEEVEKHVEQQVEQTVTGDASSAINTDSETETDQ